MKSILNKFLIILILFVITANFVFPNIALGIDSNAIMVEKEGEPVDPLETLLLGPLDGILGFLLYPIKLIFAIPAILMRLVTSAISADADLYSIFFDEVEILKINVFENSSDQAVAPIRDAIATFYMAFRNLSIVLSLAVLIYIGLRMALNNVAEERAKYKAWLVNWLAGFALIFALDFIIVFTINANSWLIEIIKRGAENYNSDFSSFITEVRDQTWMIPLTKSFGSAVMYFAFSLMGLMFLIIYLKRMITVSFLIVIAPLITVTYSIDKVGNNKSEILNTWLKEFLYNVLVQPFHCLIFIVFAGPAMQMLFESGSFNFGAMIYAIILTFSIFLGRSLIREIFGFGASSSLTQRVAVFAIAQKTLSNIKSVVAIKDARNEIRAKKAEKNLGGLKNYEMSDGEKLTGAKLVDNVVEFRKQEKYEKKAEKAAKDGKKMPEHPTKKKSMPRRRWLKNAPAPIRNAARVAGNFVASTTGAKQLKATVNKHRKKRRAPYKLTNKERAIAIAQDYRKDVNPEMTNEELANEFERISNSDITELNGKELGFWAIMQELKARYGLDDIEIKEAIKNGTGTLRGRKWR